MRVEVEPGGRSLKSQMRHADKLGARYVIIVGEDELASGALTVRDMAAQRDLPRAVEPGAVGRRELRAALAQPAPQARMERQRMTLDLLGDWQRSRLLRRAARDRRSAARSR